MKRVAQINPQVVVREMKGAVTGQRDRPAPTTDSHPKVAPSAVQAARKGR